jgi:hypothetical protein
MEQPEARGTRKPPKRVRKPRVNPPVRKTTERRTFSYRRVEGQLLDHAVEHLYDNPTGKHSLVLTAMIRSWVGLLIRNGIIPAPTHIPASEYEGWDEKLGLYPQRKKTPGLVRKFMAGHGFAREQEDC